MTYGCAWTLQAASEPIQGLGAVVQLPAKCIDQVIGMLTDGCEPVFPWCGRQFRSGGRGGCAHIGDEVGDRDIGLVTNTRNHGHCAVGDRASHALVIE